MAVLMQISMLKKLSLCAFASILVFWAISKFGDYLFSSKSLEKGVLPNSESNDSNARIGPSTDYPIKLNYIILKSF